MIETHTVNALLDPQLRQGFPFQALTFLNGLVAPTFLFCAGLGFAIFLSRKNDSVVCLGADFRSYARKSLFIIFLGYSLHIPVYSLKGMLSAGGDMWVAFLQVDILQVIGVSLLFLLLLATLARSYGSRVATVSGATLLILVSSALLSGGGYPDLPAWMLAYISPGVSPLFTLLPWAAFLTTGYLAGALFVRSSAGGGERKFISRLALGAILALGAALLVSTFTFSLYPGGGYWRSGVEFFVVRLSVILLVMCGLWKFVSAQDSASPLNLFGRESLPVYYYHLMIVYGKDFRFSYVRLFPVELNYAECFGLTLLLVLLMWGFAYSWNRLKRRKPALAVIAVRGVVAASVVAFFVS